MFVPFKEDKKSDMWLFIFDESVGVRRQTEVRKFRFWKKFSIGQHVYKLKFTAKSKDFFNKS